MIVHFEDNDYQFDIDEIDVREAIYLQNYSGMTILELQRGFANSDPKALVALYWLMMKQNGKALDINKINFKAVKFDVALTEAITADREAREAVEAEKENPTQEGGLDEAPKT